MPSDACLILFAKSPIPGSVKTRLCPPLTASQAAQAYQAFLKDTAELCEQLDHVDRILAYSGPPDLLRECVGDRWQFTEQIGSGLGERMRHATQDAMVQGYSRIVLIGSDSPGLPISYLREAFDHLREQEVVIGPSMDGGYYLIGFGQISNGEHRWLPTIFEGISWSTERVLGQTLGHLDPAALFALLAPWYDVDTENELRFLANHLRAMQLADHPFLPEHTLAFLAACDLPAGIGLLP